MFGKRIRQLGRYREIVTVLARHGFDLAIKEIGLGQLILLPKRWGKHKLNMDKLSIGERIRMAFEELGPTFIKLGQIASTRPDIVPLEIIKELEKLQDAVPSFPYEEAKRILEDELGACTSEFFTSFSETPLAAASIGQVHRAVLKSGEEVVVKIQRPNVRQQIETDLEILIDLAELAETHFQWAKTYQISSMVDEFSRSLRAELNYGLEGRHAEKISKISADDDTVYIPKVFWEYSTEKVLTLEYVYGIKLNQYDILARDGYDSKLIAERLVKSTFNQILGEGYFHGDPHPGNILVLPDNKIAYLDFGIVGRLTPEMKYFFSSLVIALMKQSTEQLVTAIMEMGLTEKKIDEASFFREMDELREKYMDVPLSKVSMGGAMLELFTVAFRHQIRIPSDLALLGKTLLTIEGTVEKLDPDLSVLDVAKPFGQKILKERYGLAQFLKHMKQNTVEFWEIFFELPKLIKENLKKMSMEHIPLNINFADKEVLFKRMNRATNLISFSILSLAFSIVLASLIIAGAIRGQSFLFRSFPFAEVGFVLISFMFMGISIAIFRSNR